jgi:hypothetical protein
MNVADIEQEPVIEVPAQSATEDQTEAPITISSSNADFMDTNSKQIVESRDSAIDSLGALNSNLTKLSSIVQQALSKKSMSNLLRGILSNWLILGEIFVIAVSNIPPLSFSH